MNRTLIFTGFLVLGAAACSRSTTPEQAPPDPPPATPKEAVPAEAPTEIPAEIPAEGSTEAPPPAPTDHRLRLGIDGDSGYTQQELTPEELAEENAQENAAAAAEPSYPEEPTEPSQAEQPSEDSGEVVEGSSDAVYMGERRAPVIRHEVRKEDEVREDVEAEHRGEARPVVRGRR